MPDIAVNDVVQVDPDVPRFGACLIVVTELKSFGIQGYVQIPAGGQAFIRLKHEEFARIGRAEWIRQAETEASDA